MSAPRILYLAVEYKLNSCVVEFDEIEDYLAHGWRYFPSEVGIYTAPSLDQLVDGPVIESAPVALVEDSSPPNEPLGQPVADTPIELPVKDE